MDGTHKIVFPSIKQAVFMDGGTDGVASIYVCVCVHSMAVEANALCYNKMLQSTPSKTRGLIAAFY